MKKFMKILFVTITCTAIGSSFPMQAKVDNKELLDAIREKNVEGVRSILQTKSLQDLNTPTEYATGDYIDMTTPLTQAISGAPVSNETTSNSKIVEMLIEKGVAFDLDHLGRASWLGNVPIVKILLKAGANPQKASTLGGSPLWFAYLAHRLDVADILLNQYPNLVHAKDATGRTHLHIIAAKTNKVLGKTLARYLEEIRHLIKHGADVHATDIEIKHFLKHGADVRATDNKGRTPDQVTDNPEAKKIIQEAQKAKTSVAVPVEEPQKASTWWERFKKRMQFWK